MGRGLKKTKENFVCIYTCNKAENYFLGILCDKGLWYARDCLSARFHISVEKKTFHLEYKMSVRSKYVLSNPEHESHGS